MNFEIMKMSHRGKFMSRENMFVEAHKDTHMTLPQIARALDIDKRSVLSILPPPDKRSPYGNRTRLWARTSLKHLGIRQP